MNSMTGFGRGESQQAGIQCSVEIKTVNSRYCDINIRSPKVINPVEHIIRQLIQSTLHRGKVEVMVTVVENGNREKKFTVNSTLKDQIKDMLIREGFYKETDTIPVQAIMAISGDWVQFQEDVVDQSVLEAMVSEATTKALHALTDMRIVEGQHIQLDLLGRLEILLQVLNRIDNVKNVAVTAYRNYLLTKMKSYLEDLHADVSEERFLQEVAILSDKTDITEEIVRFRSHVVQLGNTLKDSKPVGRKLDFLIQEMNREVNTMGSKASDVGITDDVVQLKCELEKIREQVQNIE